MTIEYRTVSEMRGDGENLYGLVTPFNTWTTIGDLKRGGFKERVSPGTFAKTLQERDVVLIHNHDTGMPMARTSIPEGYGSLSLSEDPSSGLRAQAKPIPTSYAKDVLMAADAGVIRGMSFGFEVIKDSWTDDNGNPSDAQRGTQRTIHEVRLHEVTTTAFPAYPTTELSARDAVKSAREGRVAMATYADLDTCGECGSTNEYGAYCSDCGEPMHSKKSQGNYCTSCGQELDDSSRFSHVCVKRDNPKPYGNVEYADPKNGKYPIDTEKHVKDAWSYINVAKNADEYPLNGVTLSSVKDKIKAAAKKFGIEISEENSEALALEWRDDPDGKKWKAIRQAIVELTGVEGADAAIKTLQAALPEDYTEPAATTPDEEDARDAQITAAIEKAIFNL